MSEPLAIGAMHTRLDEFWVPDVVGPDGLPMPQAHTLDQERARARGLEQENALAYGILDRSDENNIGPGISLRAATGDPTFNAKLNDLWKRRTAGKLFDVRRMFSFNDMQRLTNRSVNRDGDIAIMLVDRGFGPEVQMIDGQFIRTPSGAFNPRIVDGVEFNEAGAPVAYHVDEINQFGVRGSRRVLARDIIFLHDSTHYNIARGWPKFRGSYRMFRHIVALLEAVVVAMWSGASQALIVKVKSPAGRRVIGGRSTAVDAQGKVVQSRVIEPGMVNFIHTDEDIEGFTPTQPGQSFESAVGVFARFCGLKFGLTLERVLLDFSKANYSVSRSTALQEQRTSERRQSAFNEAFFARLWPWFASKMVKDVLGKEGPVPDEFFKYEWTPPGRPLVEPSKDAPGIEKLVNMGIIPPQEYQRELGYDPDQNIQQSSEWVEKRKKAGLPPTGWVAGTQPIQTPEEPRERDEEEDENEEKRR